VLVAALPPLRAAARSRLSVVGLPIFPAAAGLRARTVPRLSTTTT
jgi:hypothetical protein